MSAGRHRPRNSTPFFASEMRMIVVLNPSFCCFDFEDLIQFPNRSNGEVAQTPDLQDSTKH
jgi:hypothetical protein